MAQYVKLEGKLVHCYEALGSNFVICDGEQFAGLRVADAKHKGSFRYSSACTNSSLVTNGVVYDGKDVLITDAAHNPIMKNIREATKAHFEDAEFTLDNKTIEELRDLAKPNPEDAIKTGVLRIIDRESLPIEQLSDRQYSRFLFRQNAEPYGGLCQLVGIKSISVYFVPEEDAKEVGKPFGQALAIHGLQDKSALQGAFCDISSADCPVFIIPKEGIETRVSDK